MKLQKWAAMVGDAMAGVVFVPQRPAQITVERDPTPRGTARPAQSRLGHERVTSTPLVMLRG